MHVGIFVEEMRQGASQAAAFRDVFDLADRAEAAGVDCVWLGEIHFTPTRSVISASLQVASAIASRTRRLRVGTAVQVLPLNHPLRIAEEVATLDHISQGRFEFGIGRSGVVRTYDVYGIAYADNPALNYTRRDAMSANRVVAPARNVFSRRTRYSTMIWF